MRVKIPRAWVILASVAVVLCFVSFAAGTAAGPSPYQERKAGFVDGFAMGWCAYEADLADGNLTGTYDDSEQHECAGTVRDLYWEVYG